MYASVNRFSIGSDNGLSPIRRQAIILPNAGLLPMGPLGKVKWDFFLSKHKIWHARKMHLITSSAKWRPFCPGRDELTRKSRSVDTNIKMAQGNTTLDHGRIVYTGSRTPIIISDVYWHEEGYREGRIISEENTPLQIQSFSLWHMRQMNDPKMPVSSTSLCEND